MVEVVISRAVLTLREDHRRIAGDLDRLDLVAADLREGDPESVARVVSASTFFQEDLLPHLKTEEEEVFPRLKETLAAETAGVIKGLLMDHEILRSNYRAFLDPLTVLSRSPALDAQAVALVRGAAARLSSALRRHIEKEERKLFSAVPNPPPAGG